MNKCKIILSCILVCYSVFCYAGNEHGITYGYDKLNSEIYAVSGDTRKTLKFKMDYTGNPSYSFDFFSNAPAIVTDGRSLHDFTIYTTLNYNKRNFHIDCLYYEIKSKQNGILVKEGLCGLNKDMPANYDDYIGKEVDNIDESIDALDTSLLLNGKIKYLTVVINHNSNGLIYKLYESKNDLINDEFSILFMKNSGGCEVYTGNPWVITNINKPLQIEVKSEDVKNGQISLINTLPSHPDVNKCLLFPGFGVKENKAFFYDSSFNVKKSYLIKNDKINLRSISDDGKWCAVNYINNKNKTISGNMLCSDLVM